MARMLQPEKLLHLRRHVAGVRAGMARMLQPEKLLHLPREVTGVGAGMARILQPGKLLHLPREVAGVGLAWHVCSSLKNSFTCHVKWQGSGLAWARILQPG